MNNFRRNSVPNHVCSESEIVVELSLSSIFFSTIDDQVFLGLSYDLQYINPFLLHFFRRSSSSGQTAMYVFDTRHFLCNVLLQVQANVIKHCTYWGLRCSVNKAAIKRLEISESYKECCMRCSNVSLLGYNILEVQGEISNWTDEHPNKSIRGSFLSGGSSFNISLRNFSPFPWPLYLQSIEQLKTYKYAVDDISSFCERSPILS